MRLGVGRAVQVIYESIGRIGPPLARWTARETRTSRKLQPHVSNIIMCAYVCVCVASSCIVEYGKESFYTSKYC